MKKEMCVGKQVSIDLSNLYIVQGYQNRTRKNFSRTLNEIIKQWDTFSVQINKIQAKLEADELKKAEVINK
jgi:predicted transcriptional regulator YdeE